MRIWSGLRTERVSGVIWEENGMTLERILITGATGFAGKWLARELALAVPEAKLFGSSHHSTDSADLPSGFTLLKADLANAGEMAEVVGTAKPDAVFHLAGMASSYGSDREKIFLANVTGTETLLRLLSGSSHLCRVLLASSGYVYGPTGEGNPARESAALHPLGDYAESKVEMERISRPFADSGALSLTVVRAFNHTGPEQKPHLAIPTFARQIARIERGLESPIVRHGNLMSRRDFLHVRDVTRAYRQLILEAEPVGYRIVNVSSGVPVIMNDALHLLLDMALVPIETFEDADRLRPFDLLESVGDSTFLRELVDWKPEVSFEKTLAETLEWWRQQPDLT